MTKRTYEKERKGVIKMKVVLGGKKKYKGGKQKYRIKVEKKREKITEGYE